MLTTFLLSRAQRDERKRVRNETRRINALYGIRPESRSQRVERRLAAVTFTAAPRFERSGADFT